MVSALDSGLSSPGLRIGRGTALYTLARHFYCWDNPVMD